MESRSCHPGWSAVAQSCPRYSEAEGRRIRDHATALQPGRQSETPSQKKKTRLWSKSIYQRQRKRT
uniref:Uncharacterized protein n=1 Tax=Astyanax mexicanus TaxID=7994 RepID=A0A3B1KHS4_ASTMX